MSGWGGSAGSAGEHGSDERHRSSARAFTDVATACEPGGGDFDGVPLQPRTS
jgi:hypothetical protein